MRIIYNTQLYSIMQLYFKIQRVDSRFLKSELWHLKVE